MPCLSEATIVGWIEARLTPEDRVAAQAHILECPDCLELVAASRMLHSHAPASNGSPAAVGDSVSPDERYRLGAEIGAGGMGRVFESQDLVLGRTVAIKMVRDPSVGLVARFRREVAIAAMLQHPSIIPVYDAGTFSDGSAFCAMRLVDGQSLDAAIKSRTHVRARLGLVRSLIAAADAMAYAHSQNIIHRDLKPQNIILGRFGETIVLDWGLAKQIGSDEAVVSSSGPRQTGMTEVGHVVGTPAYMAPEQKRGEPADKRSDVFALGMILRQVVFGTLSRVSPRGIPKELVAIVDRATHLEPARRYGSAAELSDDLKRFETGQLVSAQKYSPLSLAGRWIKRRSGIILAATLVVSLVVGALISDSLISEAKRDAEVSEETERDAEITRQFFGALDGTRREAKLVEQRASAENRERAAEASPKSAEAQRELARAHFDVGETLFRVVVGKKDHDGALESYSKALAIRKALAESKPGDDAAHELARTHDSIGDVHYDRDELAEALAAYQRAAKAFPTGARLLRVARLHYESGDDAAALAVYRSIIAERAARLSRVPDDVDRQRDLSVAYGHVAKLSAEMGRTADAERNYRASIALAESASYQTDEWKRALAGHYLGFGRLLRAGGKKEPAREAFAKCASLYSDFAFSTGDAFDAACCNALAGNTNTAFRALRHAVENNWTNVMSIENNSDLASLRTDPRWRSLLGRADEKRPK